MQPVRLAEMIHGKKCLVMFRTKQLCTDLHNRFLQRNGFFESSKSPASCCQPDHGRLSLLILVPQDLDKCLLRFAEICRSKLKFPSLCIHKATLCDGDDIITNDQELVLHNE